MFWAAQGQGAFVQRAGHAEAQRMQCAEVDLARPGLVVVGSASHLTQETQEFVSQLKEPVFKQLGSSLKLLMVRAACCVRVCARVGRGAGGLGGLAGGRSGVQAPAAQLMTCLRCTACCLPA